MIRSVPSETDRSSGEDPGESLDGLAGAIDRGVSFLREAQLPSGEFRTLLASSPDFEEATFDSSPFVTAQVLHSLHGLDRPEVAAMARAGLRFLRRERNFGGLWRYYSRREWKHFRIPPDLDDTACASHAFPLYGERAPRNRWIFRRNRDARGRFLTWVEPGASDPAFSPLRLVRSLGDRLARRSVPERPAAFRGVERFALETDEVPLDDVDPVVNANVLLYLGDGAGTEAVAPWLAEVVAGGPREPFSHYYRNPLALFYAIARALAAGRESLAPLADAVVEKTRALEESRELRRPGESGTPDRSGDPGEPGTGSAPGPLSVALAANVLAFLAPGDEALPPMIERLLGLQREDGSWAVEAFYRGAIECWGSPELSTALALEALAGIAGKAGAGP